MNSLALLVQDASLHGGQWPNGAHHDERRAHRGRQDPHHHPDRAAVVEYALAPARMDRIVDEVRQAISWLHEHLGDYGADPGRIYVAGHSASEHLTAMTMPLGAVRGGIAISGLYDLEPIRLNYLNEKLGLDEAEAQRNSPMLIFPPMAGPLIVTCGRETAQPCHSRAFRRTAPLHPLRPSGER
jgi:arylformamidase